MKLEFSRQIFEKVSNIKFHQNPSSGSQVIPYGQTDMTKLIVAFRNFANAPNNQHITSLDRYDAPTQQLRSLKMASYKAETRRNLFVFCLCSFRIIT